MLGLSPNVMTVRSAHVVCGCSSLTFISLCCSMAQLLLSCWFTAEEDGGQGG